MGADFIVTFGELLLRLAAPGPGPLLRTSLLETGFGGAEANVAWALAGLGLDARMITVLPENELGDACVADLRRHGVDVEGVLRQPGRMGLYFLARGATLRPARVVYDREGSAFAAADPASYDWHKLLSGARRLHVSGITPALSDRSATALFAALASAAGLGVPVSFDCNFRPSLWRGRESAAAETLRRIATHADLLFGGAVDVAMLTGTEPSSAGAPEAFAAAVAGAFVRFPKLRRVAATARTVHGADHHELTGLLADRDGVVVSRTHVLRPIVDRIGAGDAYAAGTIYGLASGFEAPRIVEFAAALAAIKHGVPGDFVTVTPDDVWSALETGSGDVRR
jgi:2-dehydro-3-deoxygluconokinase